ncbi:response regulator [Reyranella sp.]|jgi:DNA-binding response OmpR family regulator|uniref:response regulator n=1 Tax=Reyranella sp. TaxID=1929291 RepID=UPI002F931DBB
MGRQLPPLDGKSVLIVEDDFLIGEDLRRMVEQAGGKAVGPAASLQLALYLADDEELDIALLDVRLPDGICAPLALLLAERDVPFVVVTAYEPMSLPSGLNKAPCMAKPFARDDLVAMMVRCFRH